MALQSFSAYLVFSIFLVLGFLVHVCFSNRVNFEYHSGFRTLVALASSPPIKSLVSCGNRFLTLSVYFLMSPILVFPTWLVTLWDSAPLSMQYAVATLVVVAIVLGIRTIHSWVQSWWKDPIGLLARVLIVLCLVVIVAQLGICNFNQASAPVAAYVESLLASKDTLTPPTFVAALPYLATAIFIVAGILGTWWFGLLCGLPTSLKLYFLSHAKIAQWWIARL